MYWSEQITGLCRFKERKNKQALQPNSSLKSFTPKGIKKGNTALVICGNHLPWTIFQILNYFTKFLLTSLHVCFNGHINAFLFIAYLQVELRS